ncbi:hypothetical protein VTI74DRAFT_5791 [Chaetomium olivicolor]
MPSTRQSSLSSTPEGPSPSPRTSRLIKTKNAALSSAINKHQRASKPPSTTDALRFNLLRNNLPGPLSQLTRFSHIHLPDIAAYVSRSAATRHAEVYAPGTKSPGRVGRPSNAFILYRKCYRARALAYCKHVAKCERGVSFVCGLSWRSEPVDVKAQFAEWAERDKEGHKEAWPDYKYVPVKPGRGSVELDGEEEEQNVEIGDVKQEIGNLQGQQALTFPDWNIGYNNLDLAPNLNQFFDRSLLTLGLANQPLQPIPTQPIDFSHFLPSFPTTLPFQPAQSLLCSQYSCDTSSMDANISSINAQAVSYPAQPLIANSNTVAAVPDLGELALFDLTLAGDEYSCSRMDMTSMPEGRTQELVDDGFVHGSWPDLDLDSTNSDLDSAAL